MNKAAVFLTLAVVLGAASITPLAADWQLLSLGPNPPEGHGLKWLIDAWRALVDLLKEGQLISSSQAADWRTNGIGIDHFLQALSVLFVVLGWIASFGGRIEASAAPTSSEVREVAVGIGQIQHAMTNVLLDPRAQAVAEPLADITRQLQSVSDVLSSMHGQARD